MVANLLKHTVRASLGALLTVTLAQAQGLPHSPKQHLGFTIGDDYQLATYTQLADYWAYLAGASDRMRLVEIGKSAEGRPQLMAIISSPANLDRLDHYRDIATRLARAEGLSDDQARALAREGKAVIWIDGGLHATEVLGAHQLIEHVWQMVSQTDPETMRILDDVIQLVVHANPDGMELVSSWYMRNPDPAKRSYSDIPRLYQKYIGHDNNRDFYLNAMPESENMSRVLYREWYPQIMYNHHQTGPAGTVMFMPPFRDPFNYVYDPLIPAGLNLVGAAMETRMAAEQKPGTTRRNGATYSTWWNGGLRTTAYFHNMIGLLTESIGSPTPMQIPLVVSRQIPTGDTPYPIEPQTWHFRQSIDYSITANRAVLDVASKYREDFLYNIYQMGRNSIDRGNRDTWTRWPRRVERIAEAAAKDRATSPPRANAGGGGFPGGGAGAVDAKYMSEFRTPELRDPRGYILPSDQPDFSTATKFVNAMLKSGIDIHRATREFTVQGKEYPAGSWVIKTAQAFRPHIIDMMEPQDHPDDLPYPGGPPRPPYDNAGYTLAMQMGVQYDRILDGFDGPFEKVTTPLVTPMPGTVARGPAGYLLGRDANDAFVAVNRLLAAGAEVRQLTSAVTAGGETIPVGTFHIPANGRSTPIIQQAAKERGLHFRAAPSAVARSGTRLQPLRIGLADRFGGSMPSGWIRYLLEQFEFPFEVVYPQRLDAGNLRSAIDVLILPDGATPSGQGGGGGRFGGRGPAPEAIPAEYRDRLGAITEKTTVPALRMFLEEGGTVLTIGSSTNLAELMGLPVTSHLVEKGPSGTPIPLPREKYYIPASLLAVQVDNTHPIAWGLADSAIVMFDQSPVFDRPSASESSAITPIAWFADGSPLRSGWAWGEDHLKGGVAVAEAKVGRGSLMLFGPEITFRAQPHGTFRFLFNGLVGGGGSR